MADRGGRHGEIDDDVRGKKQRLDIVTGTKAERLHPRQLAEIEGLAGLQSVYAACQFGAARVQGLGQKHPAHAPGTADDSDPAAFHHPIPIQSIRRRP